MNTPEILESKEKFVKFLLESGYSINKKYKDPDYKKATFVDLGNTELLAIVEFKTNEEVKKIKNHFLIDKGLTHCALFSKGRILFYRSFGEIRYFVFSNMSKENRSKIDKFQKLSENFNILFSAKDISGTFYDNFRIKRDVLVRSIISDIDDVQKYLIAQKIFDRIFFIYFLCHKRIIFLNKSEEFAGKTLFKILLENGKFIKNLYGLFEQFNVEEKSSLKIAEFKIHIPFLNGGLFRLIPVEKNLKIDLESDDWKDIFDFLNSYHWIIEDDDKEIDEEKILTPEILGHVYERSVVEWEKKGFEKEVSEAIGKSSRKELGVYYTPEYITDYICRNTIESFLHSKLEKKYLSCSDLIKNGSTHDLKHASEILDGIKILDPACGSGAFLIKAADIIFKLKNRINSRLAKKSNYYLTKLAIINNNIFGVDILKGATEIAKLRLWLWLISSYSDEREITSLPNIEYNVVDGNSLIGWSGESLSITLEIPLNDEIGELFEDLLVFSNKKQKKILAETREFLSSYNLQNYISAYSNLYNLYKNAHTEYASSLKEILVKFRKLIYKSLDHAYLYHINQLLNNKKISWHNLKTRPFHWSFDFGNIFDNLGFDIVIGNPPYVSARDMSKAGLDTQKLFFKEHYDTPSGVFDLYIVFVEKGIKLLRKNGRFGFILSNKFMINDYGIELRKFLLNNTRIDEIVDVSKEDVFDANTYPHILLLTKNNQINSKYDSKITLGLKNKSISSLIPAELFKKFPNNIFVIHFTKTELPLLEKMIRLGEPLGEKFCKMHAGTTGFNASKTAKCIVDGHTDKPNVNFIVTGNIDRYSINLGNVRYLNKKYKNPKLVLDKNLITEGKINLFTTPKIVFGGMTTRIEAAYDTEGIGLGVNVFAATDCKINEYYLLGILNSKLISFYFSIINQAKHLAGDFFAINKSQLEALPIKSYNGTNSLEKVPKEVLELCDDLIKSKDPEKLLLFVKALRSKKQFPNIENILIKIVKIRIDEDDNELSMILDDVIDQITYILYQLTDNEIALVEKKFSS